MGLDFTAPSAISCESRTGRQRAKGNMKPWQVVVIVVAVVVLGTGANVLYVRRATRNINQHVAEIASEKEKALSALLSLTSSNAIEAVGSRLNATTASLTAQVQSASSNVVAESNRRVDALEQSLSARLDALAANKTPSTIPGDLNAGLVAYYPFNGNPNDASGNGHDGTDNGATSTTDRIGAPDSAYDFDGTDYINLNANRPLVGSQRALTIAAWFFARNPSAGDIYIHRADFRDVHLYWSHSDTLGGIKWELPSAYNVFHAVRSGTLPLSQWVHCAGTYDGSVQKLYINGALVGASNWVGAVDFDADFIAEGLGGKSSDSSYRFNGKIDDVRVYNRALSAQEIEKLSTLRADH